VQTALRAAFGVDAPEELRPLTGGMSAALVYRIVVRGRPYLLRMITRTDAYADPTRELTAMQAAADAGITPRIHYASIADRLLVTDFGLVDWEAAFLNDRYVDLSIVANFFVAEADEERFLATYFGEPPGEARRAQFFLMRQAEHVFYATCFLLLAARASAALDAEAPDFGAFHAGLITGAIDLQAADAKLRYAKIHIAEALRHMR
jgi:aminoglycoside phosphotransferase (APT) family kinase protein